MIQQTIVTPIVYVRGLGFVCVRWKDKVVFPSMPKETIPLLDAISMLKGIDADKDLNFWVSRLKSTLVILHPEENERVFTHAPIFSVSERDLMLDATKVMLLPERAELSVTAFAVPSQKRLYDEVHAELFEDAG